MWIDIQNAGAALEMDGRLQLEQKLHAAFARVGRRIHRVTVYLSDVNGPRGGIDKRCVMRLAMGQGRVAVVQERDSNLHALFDRAIERSKRLVGKVADRTVRLRRMVRGRQNKADSQIDEESLPT